VDPECGGEQRRLSHQGAHLTLVRPHPGVLEGLGDRDERVQARQDIAEGAAAGEVEGGRRGRGLAQQRRQLGHMGRLVLADLLEDRAGVAKIDARRQTRLVELVLQALEGEGEVEGVERLLWNGALGERLSRHQPERERHRGHGEHAGHAAGPPQRVAPGQGRLAILGVERA
jgi:hypothetical protein